MTPQQGLPNGRKVRSFTRSRDTVLDQFIRCLVHHARLSRKLRPKRGRCDYASIQINPPKKSQATNLEPTVQDELVTQGQCRGTDRVENESMRPIEEVIDQGNLTEGKVLARQGAKVQACGKLALKDGKG